MSDRRGNTEDGSGSDASALIPDRLSLAGLRRAAAGCQACELWRRGTQTVFGEGRVSSEVMLLGEQPGDREDIEGKPFVGPAGKLLGRSLEEAGIDRSDAYITNVVKHFNWRETRGKRRIHQKPGAAEIAACRPWLESELAVVRPRVLVCLGATAGKATIGPGYRVTQDRGRFFEAQETRLHEPVGNGWDPLIVGTLHPSAILRIDDEEERRSKRAELVEDLRAVADQL